MIYRLNERKKWRPILHGALEKRAQTCIDKLKIDLVKVEKKFPNGIYKKKWLQNGMGASLFCFYHYKLTGERASLNKSESFINRTSQAVARLPMGDKLHSGFTGLAWSIEHMAGQEFADDSVEEIDEYLLTKTREAISTQYPLGNYGLLDSWVGYGVYALERWPRGKSSAILDNIIKILLTKAKRDGQGVRWYTKKENLPSVFRCGHYDLGLAHGILGIIAFLADVLKTNISHDATECLLKEAIRWFLAQNNKSVHIGYYSPKNCIKGQIEEPRLAWCFGDLAAAVVLLNAARSLNDSELAKRSIEIGRRATQFSRAESRVRDPFLCHGTSGVFHLFNYLYQMTGEGVFLDAALKWAEETMRMAETYKKFTNSRYDLLFGKSGVGLALLSGVSKVPPNWDRLYMVGAYFS